MRNELEILGVVFLVVILVAAVGALGIADQELGKMQMDERNDGIDG